MDEVALVWCEPRGLVPTPSPCPRPPRGHLGLVLLGAAQTPMASVLVELLGPPRGRLCRDVAPRSSSMLICTTGAIQEPHWNSKHWNIHTAAAPTLCQFWLDSHHTGLGRHWSLDRSRLNSLVSMMARTVARFWIDKRLRRLIQFWSHRSRGNSRVCFHPGHWFNPDGITTSHLLLKLVSKVSNAANTSTDTQCICCGYEFNRCNSKRRTNTILRIHLCLPIPTVTPSARTYVLLPDFCIATQCPR